MSMFLLCMASFGILVIAAVFQSSQEKKERERDKHIAKSWRR